MIDTGCIKFRIPFTRIAFITFILFIPSAKLPAQDSLLETGMDLYDRGRTDLQLRTRFCRAFLLKERIKEANQYRRFSSANEDGIKETNAGRVRPGYNPHTTTKNPLCYQGVFLLREPRRMASGQAGLEPFAGLRICSNSPVLQIPEFYEFHIFHELHCQGYNYDTAGEKRFPMLKRFP